MFFLAFVAAVNVALLLLFRSGYATGLVAYLYGTLACLAFVFLAGAVGALDHFWLVVTGGAFLGDIVMVPVGLLAAIIFDPVFSCWRRAGLRNIYFLAAVAGSLAILGGGLAFYAGLVAMVYSFVGMLILMGGYFFSDRIFTRPR